MKQLCIVLVVISIMIYSLYAQTWENIGFDKEVLSAVAIDPIESNILYFGTI